MHPETAAPTAGSGEWLGHMVNLLSLSRSDNNDYALDKPSQDTRRNRKK
jgi:hypothetical protein